ncbi:NADH-quinone oxidoreductase subunit H [Aliifodinibius sp. 1BSP15-2V2]|uniref:NADH-quinone oxidoreductase subunit H n=1 Tax=Fodinibius salsisoli TaxID=2820877 RepID=A0ABT3PJY5_9BACT|nr:NADH-quinone oxidoreductase subunit H [Fodinibius salsisoli]
MLTWIAIGLLFAAGVYFVALLEQWSLQGYFDWAAPFNAFLRSFGQEEIRTRRYDTVFYEATPVIFIAVVLLAVAILPFARETVILDLGTAALFINAALVYIMVSLIMAGWSANGVYGMIGGWRAMAQLIAYSMAVVMAITAAVMRAESMAMTPIIQSQASLWNIFYQPVGFLLFYGAVMAIAFLPPFDLPTAEGELAGGAWAEFTGARKTLFRLGRLLLILTLSLAVTIFFLGGWLGPWLPGFVWTFIKTTLVAASFFWVGRYFPRIRHDHLLEWGWKYAVPAALFNILQVGIVLLL